MGKEKVEGGGEGGIEGVVEMSWMRRKRINTKKMGAKM